MTLTITVKGLVTLDFLGDSRKAGVAIAMFAIGYVNQSFAAPGDSPRDSENSVVPYVAGQETYDSNLYRLPSYITNVASLVAPNARRQDYISTVYAGVDGQWMLAQQAISINLRVDENRFTRNKALNNYSGNADLLWNWRLGSVLSGQAGVDYSRSLASFAETLYLGRDLVAATAYFGNARYQIGPRWAVYGGLREADTSHSAVAAQANDAKNRSLKTGIEYSTTIDNTVSFEYRYTNGLFTHGNYLLNGMPFDRDYRQSTASLLVKYVLSDKTAVDASVGYLKRDYTHESIGAFSGDVWRASLQWQATEKTQVVVAAWQELQAYFASESDYFVAKGGSISPVWAASEKFSLSVTISAVRQDYISTSQSVVTLGARHDKLNTAQGSMSYAPTRALKFNFSYGYQKRDSNQAQFKFNDNSAIATLTFKF